MTFFQTFLQEAKRRGLDCGVNENTTVIASKPETKTQTWLTGSLAKFASLVGTAGTIAPHSVSVVAGCCSFG